MAAVGSVTDKERNMSAIFARFEAQNVENGQTKTGQTNPAEFQKNTRLMSEQSVVIENNAQLSMSEGFTTKGDFQSQANKEFDSSNKGQDKIAHVEGKKNLFDAVVDAVKEGFKVFFGE